MSRRSSTAPSAEPSGRVLHLEPFSGIAGNMFLGAMLDLGLPRRALESDLAGLDLDFALKVSKVRRGALACRHVEVRVPGAPKPRARKAVGRRRGAGAEGAQEPAEPHLAHDGHGRSYGEVVAVIERSRLAPAVKERALLVFEALGRAEARIHGRSLAETHFHEVGAVDAIVDIAGAAIAIERLGVDHISCGPVALGHGAVETAHGRLPLPAPATLELLKGIPTVPAPVAWETVTPTGAALVRALVDVHGQLPALTVEAIGYGAGNDRPGPMPNCLRAVLGTRGGLGTDRVAVLECHLDDLVPEHFDHLLDRLMEAGALDVALQHLQMKKNRPGFALRVIARPADARPLAEILFFESTTIGVRTSEWDRWVLARESRRVETPFGRLRVKVVWLPDGRPEVSAEYDDCKRAAAKHGVALREVVRVAEDAARASL